MADLPSDSEALIAEPMALFRWVRVNIASKIRLILISLRVEAMILAIESFRTELNRVQFLDVKQWVP